MALKEPVEIVHVDTAVVSCEGIGGALGHPKVYLNIEASGEVDCPYCGRRFILNAGAKAHSGH
jgi:uncharacterized Zn-finger protein